MSPLPAAELLPLLVRAARDGPDAVLDLLQATLAPHGFDAERIAGENGAMLLQRGEAAPLVFSGHVDVVPVGEGWTRDPFGGETAEGRVWGRGACDMLGGVAAFADAAVRVPELPAALVLTTDEETSMKAASRALDAGWLAGAKGVVVGEPTSHAVGIAEKGVLWVRVEARGRNAHGSMPELGDNAAERLLRLLPRVLEVRPQGRHALLGAGTRNLGQMHSGAAVNQVPALAFADLDIRYLPGETDAELLARLREALRASGEPETEIKVISSHVPFETPETAPVARAALDAVRAERGTAQALGLPYGTEASKFAPAGLDVVILGPGEPGLAHTNRESITLDDLDLGARVYARMLRAHAGAADAPADPGAR